MWKKAVSLMLVAVLVLSAATVVSAQSIDTAEQAPVPTRMAYISSTNTSLTISSGQASAYARLIGYPGTTTKISITMTLQKQGFLGLYWSDVTGWSDTFYSSTATMSRTHSGLSGGTYRLKAVYTAYSGNASETVTEYSPNFKY